MPDTTAATGPPAVLVVSAREDFVIADEAAAILSTERTVAGQVALRNVTRGPTNDARQRESLPAN